MLLSGYYHSAGWRRYCYMHDALWITVFQTKVARGKKRIRKNFCCTDRLKCKKETGDVGGELDTGKGIYSQKLVCLKLNHECLGNFLIQLKIKL